MESLNISFDYFLETLPIMGKGMLGIFIVVGVIIGTIKLLSLIPTKEKNDK